MINVPENSPWGEVQHCKMLCNGVYEVATASHGGIMAESAAAKKLFSVAALRCGFKDGSYVCFEEDCQATVAIRELLDKGKIKAPVNEYFKPGEYEKLIDKSVQRWYPDYWNAREHRQHKDKSEAR